MTNDIYPPRNIVSPKKNLLQRWMEWSGSFLVLSLLLHAILIGLAAWLVVSVVGSRKKELKFTAPPPAPVQAEHKVKPAKKTSVSAPPVMKRIASTALNAKVVLPEVSMSSPSTDVMSSVMSGIGSSGLGMGGSPGLASLPLTGLTAFGFKGRGGGMIGTYFDLGKIVQDSNSPGSQRRPVQSAFELQPILTNFVSAGMDNNLLSAYTAAQNKIVQTQIYIPKINANDAPEAFEQKKTTAWLIHYKGTVIAPVSGTYTFWGVGDDVLVMQIDGKVILDCGFLTSSPVTATRSYIMPQGLKPFSWFQGLGNSQPIQIEAGKSYQMDILIGHAGGGSTSAFLLVELQGRDYKRDKNGNPVVLPLFQLIKADVPPELEKEAPVLAPPTDYSVWRAAKG
jgi:hypothetical protein